LFAELDDISRSDSPKQLMAFSAWSRASTPRERAGDRGASPSRATGMRDACWSSRPGATRRCHFHDLRDHVGVDEYHSARSIRGVDGPMEDMFRQVGIHAVTCANLPGH
jgi:hypothetical protein